MRVLVRSPLVLQVFVYGDSLQSHLVAIVVPDPEELEPWANKRGIKKEFSQLCRDSKVIEGVLSSMHAEGRLAKLRGFEQVQLLCLKRLFCYCTVLSVWSRLGAEPFYWLQVPLDRCWTRTHQRPMFLYDTVLKSSCHTGSSNPSFSRSIFSGEWTPHPHS